MKKHLFLLLFVVFLMPVRSQEFRVKSAVELMQDTKAKIDPRFDKNGQKCALVRLNIPSIKDVRFQTPIVGEPMIEPGEYSVYVSPEITEFTFECDNRKMTLHFSDYKISLEPIHSYRFVITNAPENVGDSFADFFVSANFEDDILLIDGYPMGQLPLDVDGIKIGTHTFSVPNTNGRLLKDTVIDVSESTKIINLNLKTTLQVKESFEMEAGPTSGDTYSAETYEPEWTGLHIVKQNGRKGLADKSGTMLIPCNYDYIESPNDIYEGYLLVGKDANRGVYKIGVGEVVPCVKWLQNYYVCENSVLALMDRTNCTSMRDAEEKVISVTAAAFYDISKQRFVVSNRYRSVTGWLQDGRLKYYIAEDSIGYRYILNANGNQLFITPFKGHFNMIFDNEGEIGLWSWWQNGRMYEEFFSLNGNRVPLPEQYDVVSGYFYKGLLAVKDVNTGKIGFINTKNQIVIPIKYEFNDQVSFSNDKQFSFGTVELIDENGYSYYFTPDGSIVAQTKPGYSNSYQEITKIHDSWGRSQMFCQFLCKTFDDQIGVLDSLGNIIIPFSTNNVRYDEEPGIWIVEYPDKEVSYYNKNGKQIVPKGKYEYDGFNDSHPFMANLYTGENLVCYDNMGNQIVNIPFKVKENYVVVDDEGDIVDAEDIDAENDAYDIILAIDGHFYMDKNGNSRFEINGEHFIIRKTKDYKLWQVINPQTHKCGYMSEKGDVLTSCIYDEYANYFNLGEPQRSEFDTEDEFQESLSYFNSVVRPIFELTINSWSASEGYGIICLGGLFGFIDVSGKVVVPLKYSYVTPFVDGVSYVKDRDGKWTKLYSKDLR